jgi:hypothetical protein
MVDNAPAMPARRRTVAAPAQVVERAALDAQQDRCLVDGEKGRLVIRKHEDLHSALASPSLQRSLGLGEAQFAEA